MKLLLISSLILAAVVAAGVLLYVQQPKFGPSIDATRFTGAQGSPHYRDGEFQNLEPTTVLAGDNTTLSIILKGMFNRPDNLRPDILIPARKTDLKSLDRNRDLVVWLGHSSWFVQIGGRRILVDPVFSRYASPVPFANEAFAGTGIYTAADMPEIDYLLITHDHWDHLDYPSIDALRDKVRHVVCGLGVGQYFAKWGYPEDRIHAGDWFTSVTLDPGLTIHILPARHYSGRMLTKNQTLWVAFALESPEHRILLGGDSGYGKHFAKIDAQFGHFDLVALDMGQYDDRWRYIHMTPEEAAQAAEELHAAALLPAHVGKFTIANHAWDEPFERIVRASLDKSYRLLTPQIGEPVDLANHQQRFAYWWRQTPARADNVSSDTATASEMSHMKISLTANGQSITATLTDSPTSRDFIGMLPLTLTLKEYANTEKIAYLPRKLSQEGAPDGVDPDIGDLTYYAPWGNLALFYKDFGYAKGLIKLGRVDGSMDMFRTADEMSITIDLLHE